MSRFYDALQAKADRKLSRWSDMCEAAEVGVAIPGLDQTLIMWALRRELSSAGVVVRYERSLPGAHITRDEKVVRVPEPLMTHYDMSAISRPVTNRYLRPIDFHCRFHSLLAGNAMGFALMVADHLRGSL